MANDTKERLVRVETKIEEMCINEIPHIQSRLDKIEARLMQQMIILIIIAVMAGVNVLSIIKP